MAGRGPVFEGGGGGGDKRNPSVNFVGERSGEKGGGGRGKVLLRAREGGVVKRSPSLSTGVKKKGSGDTKQYLHQRQPARQWKKERGDTVAMLSLERPVPFRCRLVGNRGKGGRNGRGFPTVIVLGGPEGKKAGLWS